MNFLSSRVLHKDHPRREYKPSKEASLADVVVKGLHYGQRKLFLSEVEFLAAIYDKREREKSQSKPVLAVYAGAANGSHLPFLFELFPETFFILIDPAPFCDAVKKVAQTHDGPVVELLEDYCTDELCLRISRSYEEKYDIYLISDIRSGVPCKTETNAEHTEIIMRDNEWQRSWCWSLRAQAAMLKFHPPYPAVADPQSKYYDANDKTPEAIEYLDGQQLFGVWAPKSSSEVRLVVTGPFTRDYKAPMRSYGCKEHEEQCYHYNTTGRFTRDRDAEKTILDNYLHVFPNKFKDNKELSALISTRLKFPMFLPLNEDFTECNARWLYLLESTRNPNAVTKYYNLLKKYMTVGKVRELVETYHVSEAVPDAVKAGDVVLSTEFWQIFCRGDFGEAYSFPRIRWNFFRLLLAGSSERKRKRPQ